MNNDWQVWVAVYAAIVATGAVFLEVRRWFESGPRLYLMASTNMIFVGGGADRSIRYACISVSNRGSLPTTITNLCLLQYDNWWRKFRNKPIKSAVEGVVDAVFAAISEALAEEEAVQIASFGTFAARSRPARIGRSPRTGESLSIPASKSVSFKASKALKDMVS